MLIFIVVVYSTMASTDASLATFLAVPFFFLPIQQTKCTCKRIRVSKIDKTQNKKGVLLDFYAELEYSDKTHN